MTERRALKCPPSQSVPREFRKDRLEVLKAKWRDQVMADSKLTASSQVLAYWMADFITMDWTRGRYKETSEIIIFPSQRVLEKQAGFHIETIATGISKLIRRGHLYKLKRGNQITGSNRYLVIVKPPKSKMSI
jgi:hypothetical protein